jgi:uncharacterized protein (DUF302 family)
MEYYNSKIVNTTFEETLVKVAEELKNEGFGVLTEIDVKSTLKNKLDVDFRKYKILGACNPSFAYRALQIEENLGVLLPCNVVVQETEKGEIHVTVVNPLVSMQAVGNEKLNEVAGEVSKKLLNVLNKL